MKRDNVASIKEKFSDSPIWKDLMKVKEVYVLGREVTDKCGNIARLWKELWDDTIPLLIKSPSSLGFVTSMIIL